MPKTYIQQVGEFESFLEIDPELKEKTMKLFNINLNELVDSSKEAERIISVKLHTEEVIAPTYSGYTLYRDGWNEEKRVLFWDKQSRGYNYSLIEYSLATSLPTIGIIISTYNQPEWLEKVLWGYEAQTEKNFELIIADDGSGEETYERVKSLMPFLSYPIKHIWHEDKGFRKCNILNKAIVASSAPYLLFSDGDCIPRADFIATHLAKRKSGRFLSNGYHKLSMKLSKTVDKASILSGNCFQISWLKKHGMSSSFKNNKLDSFGFKEWLLNTFTPTNASWNGHGASAYKEDIYKVNGFDERMKYGGEDREIGERLENIDIHGKQIRYSTVCLHLDHARGYVNAEDLANNKRIRVNTKKNKKTYTSYGIVKSDKDSDWIVSTK